MKIVFMGTPWFAVPSLENLIKNGYDVAAVVTQPDRKRGRGQKQAPSPVKITAEKNCIPVLQFDKIKSQEGVCALKELKPDIIITAAFGQLLSKEILEIPKLGCINVHASLLPKYRGAAPIQWAIINGETTTGVTIMYMDEGLDTGDIISQKGTDIPEDMTGGELYEKLAVMGAELLVETLPRIMDGTAQRIKQSDEESSYYPLLTKDMGKIDWTKTAKEVYDLVRAMNPVMSVYATMGDCTYKVRRTSIVKGSAEPGEVLETDNKKQGILVGTGKNLICIEELQAPNCKCMRSLDFLNGRKLNSEQFDC